MSMRAREEDARAATASAAPSVESGDAQDDRVTQECSSSASAASSASSTEASTTANSSSEGTITSRSSSSPSLNAKNTITLASCPGEVEDWELTEECKDASILPEIWDKEYDHDPSAELLPGSADEAQLERNKTDGKGPILVVSSSPSIAAGVPSDLTRRQRGALCGFLGQIPVKCMGPVECGDLMVPSGLHDGLAISGRLSHADRLEPLGYAMETHDQSELCHVTCLVRWHGDPRWQSLRDRRLCELRHRWYAEVLPREVAGILTRGFLLFFAGFQPSFGASAALIALGMEIGALLVVLIVEQYIKPEYFESYPVVLLVKTVVNMYLLSQLFHTTDVEGAHVHQDDLGQLGKDIGFLLLDVAFRAL
ncbi:Hypothetical Protein FCC1311_062512 [Hondaea fermentalgiana]|uniref:Uncharacterized protein n=1 Tax=Hondaea fermentalgiana TaxID=2315210 RepID=A0A2R5GNZ7_9STRA|nr:Hypothetical Protein FCC1311_062512 [Hondaea fermentalgiana]|eukprot:GBG30031.1 Hypothetical Protein FCC1311_062512 [Hondaea fermentalgiana]